MSRFEVHSHTHYSNIRLLDCINKPKDLIDRAIELGLKGIAITDHECLSGSIQIYRYAQEIKEKYPDFKVALGNEIYLTPDRSKGQVYYHFILIAKDEVGHKQLRQLSSIAWLNSYTDRGMERVPTTYEDIERIIGAAPGHVVATTACIGGQLGYSIRQMEEAERFGRAAAKKEWHESIVDFILWCKDIFGDNFYIECAPGCSEEQIAVNKRTRAIANAFDVKMVVGSDAHYLRKEDRYVHKSYLTSNEKNGKEREVDAFYEYSYLQTPEEEIEHLAQSDFEEEFVKEMWENSIEISNKIFDYNLFHKQSIPSVPVEYYPPVEAHDEKHPILSSLLGSEDKYDRYWINQCLESLKEKGLDKDPAYLDRLEEEADIKKVVSEKLETNMFKYPVTLQHYINLFWECGSTVGAGRGSACSGLNHYLLGVTQLDPIKWELPFWRYLNKERIELGDIDLDLCPSKRPQILNKIKEERGKWFYDEIDDVSRKNLGCALVATFGTESTKSAILTACRGYRSEKYPQGISSDQSNYISSLVPIERGFVWSIEDLIHGNAEKGRKPQKKFIDEVSKYPRLLEIMQGIDGLVNKRSSHASGVILFDEDPYYNGCFMKTKGGDVITQYDLHDCEAVGMTKYDFLLTEVQDKITKCIELLQEYGCVDKNKTIKEVYDEYLHPDILDVEYQPAWDGIADGSIINVFQFDSPVGRQAAKKIQPKNIIELADANGLMRLMTAEKGGESPLDKYVRFKNNIDLWYREMSICGLTKEEQKVLEPYFLSSYGVPPSQEQMMKMLMDENICNFMLKEANSARKIVGKKQMDKIPELREQVFEQAASPALGKYVWEKGIGPQMGYSFSIIHALAYSFVGYQTAYLASRWDPIFWSTACLIVNSGALDTDEEREEDEDEDDVEQKEKQTDYAKIAKALNNIISQGIKVSLVNINNSSFEFKPDAEHHQIYYGLKAVRGVNKEAIETIIANRPYKSIKDFMHKVKLKKTSMVSLIKAGAFDEIDKEWAAAAGIVPTRMATMSYYISQIAETKSTLNLRNLGGLIKANLIPDEYAREKAIYDFTTFVKKYRLKKSIKEGNRIYLNQENDLAIYEKLELPQELLQQTDNGVFYVAEEDWTDVIYENVKDVFRPFINKNLEQLLTDYNTLISKEIWEKYGKGTIPDWEMDAMCFYYTKHELGDIDLDKYGIVNFFDLPEEPVVERYYKKTIPCYQLTRIAGTVIAKDDNRTSAMLLTTDGVVTVKFTREFYAMFKKRITAPREDGTNQIIDPGWFTQGTKLIVTGFRRDDQFVCKKYGNTSGHQIYKITEVDHEKKDIILESERAA